MKNFVNKCMLALMVLASFGLASCGDDDDDKKTGQEEVNYADAQLLKIETKFTAGENFFGPLVNEVNYEYNADGYVSSSSDLSSENNLYDTFDYSKLKSENKIVVTHKNESGSGLYDDESICTYYLENGRVTKIVENENEVLLKYNGKNQLTDVVYREDEYAKLTWENDFITKYEIISGSYKDEGFECEITYSNIPMGQFGGDLVASVVMCYGSDGIGLNGMFGATPKYYPKKEVIRDYGEGLIATREFSFDSLTKLLTSVKVTETETNGEAKTQTSELTLTWDVPSKK